MHWVAYLLFLLPAAIAGWLLWIHLASSRLRGREIGSLAALIPGLQDHRGRAALYCYADSCGACRQLTPVIDRMREEYDNLHKLDLQAHPRLARKLGIRAVPTTLLIEDGKILKVILGPKAPKSVAVFLHRKPPADGIPKDDPPRPSGTEHRLLRGRVSR